MSGYLCSLAYLARADLGFATMTEMAGWSKMIAAATRKPVVADADDGYGDVLQVMRTVEEFERTGVAGISLEDQIFPKRCGHLPGKRCHSTDDAVARLKAALQARSDPSFVIIARTDIIGVQGGGGVAEAIERGRRYAGTGADMVWAEFSSPSRADAEAFAVGVRKGFPDLPLFFNYSSSFRWRSVPDAMTFRALGDLGYRFIVVGLGAIHAGLFGEWNFLANLREKEERAQCDLEATIAGHPTESHHALGRVEDYESLAASFRR